MSDSKITVVQTSSPIGRPAAQRQTLVALGLNKIGRGFVVLTSLYRPWHDRQGRAPRPRRRGE